MRRTYFMKAACAALCFFAWTAVAYAAPTIVGTLDGATVWANPPAVGSGTAEQETISGAPVSALRVTVSTKASAPNEVQVLSQPFLLTNGQQYTITYQAKADASRTVPAIVRINAPDWHSVGYANPGLRLSDDWQTFTQTFTATQVGSGNNVVAFSLGDQIGSVWIAGLKLTTDGPIVPVAPAHSGKNVVATFVGAVVWANPPAAAAGSLENATLGSAAPTSALRITISAKADNLNDVQVLSTPFVLTEGQRYTLTYDAKSDAARTGIVSVRVQGGDYHSVGYSNAAVPFGTDWRAYTETFTASKVGSGNNIVAFTLGAQTGSVWIANLKLTTDGPVNQSELPGGPGVPLASIPNNAYRILFVGNSITQHGVADVLGWDHVAGMAASSPSKDYVHLLTAKIQALMSRRPVATRIASLIPGGLGSPDYRISPVIADLQGYDPNLVIIQHGEHEQEPVGVDTLAQTYNQLLDLFTTAPSPPKIVCVGVWSSQLDPKGAVYTGWSATVEQTMHDICAKRGIPYVSVVSIAADPADHGFGKDPGVQWHPNDQGQAKYADAIFAAVRPLLMKSALQTAQSPAALHISGKPTL